MGRTLQNLKQPFLQLLPLSLFAIAQPALGVGRGGPDPMQTFAPPTPVHRSAPKCKVYAKNDPFGISAALQTGPHQGECIDTNEFRGVKKLSEKEQKAFFSPAELAALKKQGVRLNDPKIEVVANFLGTDAKGKNHNYVAIIPTQRVRRSIIQLVSLSHFPPISHGQIRFDMSGPGPGIILVDQTTKSPRVMKELHDDVVITLEGVHSLKQGKGLGAAGLQSGYYSEEISIGSNKAETVNWTKSEKLMAYQYVANFSKAESRAALKESIRQGNRKGVTAPYDVFTTSCSNFVFDVFHKVTHTPNVHVPMQSLAPMESLRDLGWINRDGTSQIESINDQSWFRKPAAVAKNPAPKKKRAPVEVENTDGEEIRAGDAK